MAISKFDVLKRMEQTGKELHFAPKVAGKASTTNGRGYVTMETDPIVVQKLQNGEELGLFLVAFNRAEFKTVEKDLKS